MSQPPKVTTVEKVIGETETVYVEHQKNDPIDKFALAKFLKSQPPPLELETVTVRCNRDKGEWAILDKDGNPVQHSTCMVLVDAVFVSEVSDEERVNLGCGHYENGYIGTATGKRLPVDRPVSVPNDKIQRLRFDPKEGKFVCNGKSFKAADYLILKEGCSSEVIGPRNKIHKEGSK